MAILLSQLKLKLAPALEISPNEIVNVSTAKGKS